MDLYKNIKIILADDHELFRDGFSAMLKKESDIELLGEAKDGEELIRLTRLFKPDIVVTDIVMPVMSGIDATKMIVKDFPHIGVIALSMSNQDNLIVQMIEAGAQGFLIKNAHKDEIVEAIKTVHNGDKYYCKSTTGKLTKILTYNNYLPVSEQRASIFSAKEFTIIRLICRGHSSQQIADELKHSIRTIDSYRKNILKKMNVKNVTGILKYAIKNKIYYPEEIETELD
ncbi:MAG: response regulator transcription factor [Chitinophagaceae bacterium]|nr:response regulator transcription factor [Chitinophagaceae bacterium]